MTKNFIMVTPQNQLIVALDTDWTEDGREISADICVEVVIETNQESGKIRMQIVPLLPVRPEKTFVPVACLMAYAPIEDDHPIVMGVRKAVENQQIAPEVMHEQ